MSFCKDESEEPQEQDTVQELIEKIYDYPPPLNENDPINKLFERANDILHFYGTNVNSEEEIEARWEFMTSEEKWVLAKVGYTREQFVKENLRKYNDYVAKYYYWLRLYANETEKPVPKHEWPECLLTQCEITKIDGQMSDRHLKPEMETAIASAEDDIVEPVALTDLTPINTPPSNK